MYILNCEFTFKGAICDFVEFQQCKISASVDVFLIWKFAPLPGVQLGLLPVVPTGSVTFQLGGRGRYRRVFIVVAVHLPGSKLL